MRLGRGRGGTPVRISYQTPAQLRKQAEDLRSKANEARAQWELARRQHDEAAQLVLALGHEMRSLRAQAEDAEAAAHAAKAYGQGPNFGRAGVER